MSTKDRLFFLSSGGTSTGELVCPCVCLSMCLFYKIGCDILFTLRSCRFVQSKSHVRLSMNRRTEPVQVDSRKCTAVHQKTKQKHEWTARVKVYIGLFVWDECWHQLPYWYRFCLFGLRTGIRSLTDTGFVSLLWGLASADEQVMCRSLQLIWAKCLQYQSWRIKNLGKRGNISFQF